MLKKTPTLYKKNKYRSSVLPTKIPGKYRNNCDIVSHQPVF